MESVDEWVVRTCAEQGVPVKITDPRVIAHAATLLNSGTTLRTTND